MDAMGEIFPPKKPFKNLWKLSKAFGRWTTQSQWLPTTQQVRVAGGFSYTGPQRLTNGSPKKDGFAKFGISYSFRVPIFHGSSR